MKPVITAILILGGLHPVNAQVDYDPFAEPDIQKKVPLGTKPEEHLKIRPKYIATTGGTIGWEDTRAAELMSAVSAFYNDNKRVPASMKELTRFASIRGYAIGSPNTLTSVEFVDGSFNYSVRYSDGRISLSHILFFDIKKAEQDSADQPATAPELKLESEEKPKPESEVRPQ